MSPDGKSVFIYGFSHDHKPGEVCSIETCRAALRAPVLAGVEVFADIPMRILRTATEAEYLSQPIPDGWCIPPGNIEDRFYLVELIHGFPESKEAL